MNTTPDYAGPLPAGWTGGHALTKWWRGAYVHLYTLRKPCAECGGEMRIDVTRDALEGKVKNAGLHLKRCAKCRAISRAAGSSSRPKIAGQEPFIPAAVTAEELEQLRTANATMREELDTVHAENRELRRRLSSHEGPTLAEALRMQATLVKMPWEQ